MSEAQREEDAYQIAELIAQSLEADEKDGGCSPSRSAEYQAAFAACLALCHAEGATVFLETFFDHIHAEIGRLLRNKTMR